MKKELREKFKRLLTKIKEAIEVVALEKDKDRLKDLEENITKPDFWDNSEEARRTMLELSELKNHIEKWEEVLKETVDSLELLEITQETEHDIFNELKKGAELIEKNYEELEELLLMNGEYDKFSTILSIYSGAGGTDSQDWAEMLLRMYLRYAEKENFTTNIISITPGEEAGIKNVSVEVKGLYSYGFLKNERGVHRLVRLSPFDADNARHTSFALVEVYPILEGKDYNLKEDDLRIETFRASGHGGQSVNTTDSAVRITHLPTGLTASCQNERSQLQNKNLAMKVLVSKIRVLEEEKKKKEAEEIRGESISAEWGSQIRSYVLHPYNMVKDLRTGYETSNTQKVLDGDISDFIDANLKLNAKK